MALKEDSNLRAVIMHMLNAHNSANLKKDRLTIVVYVVVGSSSCGLILITSLHGMQEQKSNRALAC